MSVCLLFFLERYGDHRDLHVLTHSFPTRRSSDLAEGAAQRGVGEPKCAAFWGDRASLTGVSSWLVRWEDRDEAPVSGGAPMPLLRLIRSEEHTSELQSLMRISYAVFCLTKKKQTRMKHVLPYSVYLISS